MFLYVQDSILVTNNKINMPYGNYGIYGLYFGNSSYGNLYHNLIANNFVSIGSMGSPYSNYAMALYYNDNLDVVYNNTNVYGKANYSYGAFIYHYTTTSDVNIHNNSFFNQNTGGGDYGLYGYNWTDENYNNIYTNGSSLVYYSGSTYSTLSAWSSSGVGFGANDVSDDPLYTSNTDLHVSSTTLNAAATPISGITQDIDAQVRNTTTPDIGADEFTPPAIGAGVKITGPTSGFCVGTQDVYVRFQNRGANTLTTATIEWSVNGVAQTSYSWTGSLSSGKYTSFKVGSYNFSSASTIYNIVSYASDANGTTLTKSVATGNSDSVNVGAGLKGSFTIDQSGAGDYTSFRAAVSDLNMKGVCGAITYTVSDGTYNESVLITKLPGASSVNTVTFQSKSKDSSKVIIDTAWGGSYSARGYALRLQGASYVTFNQISIYNIPSSMYTYSDVVELTGGASHNTISNAVIATSTTYYSTYGSVIYNDGSSIDPYNTFSNNQINGGYYIIYMAGSGLGASAETGNVFIGNTIDSGAYMGAYITYQDSINFSGNNLSMNSGYYGLYLYYVVANGGGTDSSLISNNFINFQSTYGYAMFTYYANMLNVYNNSFNSTCAYTFYYELYMYNSSGAIVNLVNNIYNDYSGGALFYISNVNYSDYNDYWTTGGTWGYFNGTSVSSLAGLTGGGTDMNSVSGDPYYNNTATSDLHLTSLSLSVVHTGTPRGMVVADIDNQKRAPKPNIGADETHTYLNDAASAAIDSPASGFCSGTKSVYLKLLNTGSLTMTTANLHWSVDGVAQTTLAWTGSLVSGASTSVKLGSVTFAAGTSKLIKIWTDSPNSAVDSNTSNDAISGQKGGGLSGTLTIGGVSPDYATFRDAVSALKTLGVCGTTQFVVADGTYNESINITAITGAGPTATITFISKSKDSTKVIVDTSWSTSSSAAPGYVVNLNGASYISFDYMTLMNTPSYSYSYTDAIFITGKSSHNYFNNNIITDYTGATGNYGYCVHNDYNSNDPYNTFSNNQINGGYYGVYLTGPYSTTNGETGNVFYHNMIDSANYMGVMAEYEDSMTLSGNNINMSSGYFGIYLYGIQGNGSGSDSSYIINNFVSMTANGYALFGYTSDMLNIYNNSFDNNSSSYYTVYMYDWTTHIVNFNNNIVQNDGSGYALYNYGSITTTDFNNWFTNGGTLASWAGTSCSSLSDLQAADGQDVHSVSNDAMFNSSSTGDLHLTSGSAFLMHIAYPYTSITEDIDQEKRTAVPNIGADETKVYDYDASAAAIDSPAAGFCSGTKDVYVRLRNAGAKTLTSVTIDWSVNGSAMTTYSWTGSLASFSSTLVKLGSVSFAAGSSKVIKAWTSNPNGVTDLNPSNDTISKRKGGGLTGTYTIGSGGSYASFRDAVTALNGQGICGPVVFNVFDGYYNESVEIKAILGASAINTITFQSKSLDSTKVVLDTTTSGSYSAHGYTVRLNGANYITFRKMSITNIGGSYSYDDVVQFTAGASHNTLESNVMFGNTGGGYNYGSIIYDNPNSIDEYNTFKFNQISGNYYTIWLVTYSGQEFGNVFYSNNIDSGNGYGAYIYYQDSMTFSRNNVYMTAGYEGVYIYENMGNGGGTDSSIVSNNFITTSGSYTNSLYIGYSNMINVYSNSINNSSTGYYYSALYLYNYSTGSVNVTNNLLVCDNTATPVIANGSGAWQFSDFNDYYTASGSYLAMINGSTYCYSVSDIQSATGFDVHSISADPLYNSPSTADLHATSSSTAISNVGAILSTVTTDIDGDPRSTSKPDMGADEFGSSPNDLGVTAIPSPKSGDCGNAGTVVEVKVHNFGTSAQTSFGFAVKVTIGAKSYTATRTVSRTINAGADDTAWVSFSPALNTSAGGNYFIKAYTTLSGDADNTNDSDTVSVKLTVPPTAKLSVAKSAICMGDSFAVSDGTGLSGATYAYALVNLSGKTVASSTSKNPYLKDPTGGSGYYRIVQGVRNGGTCYDSTSIPVTINAKPKASFTDLIGCPGASSTFDGSGSTAGSGTISSYAWNFGNGNKASTDTASTVFAKGTYTVSLKVTNSNLCSDSTTALITVATPNSAFTYSIDSSTRTASFTAKDNTSTGYAWTYGDLGTGSGSSSSHQYTTDGKYYVTLQVTNGGCSSTTKDSVIIIHTGISTDVAGNFNMNIYPNPFKEYTTIAYTLNKVASVKVEVSDVLGRSVATLVNTAQSAGDYTIKFNATEYNGTNAGIYIVRMTIGDRIITRQITLVK